MREEDFIAIFESEVQAIKDSPQYTKYRAMDRALFENEELIKLNVQKEEFIKKIEFNPEDVEALTELHLIQTRINDIPEVKEYYRLRQEIKNALELITKEVLHKI